MDHPSVHLTNLQVCYNEVQSRLSLFHTLGILIILNTDILFIWLQCIHVMELMLSVNTFHGTGQTMLIEEPGLGHVV